MCIRDRYIHAGDNVITTEMEHHANIVPWQLICERKGAELRVVPFDDAGRLMTEKLPELLDERTRIVCIDVYKRQVLSTVMRACARRTKPAAGA